MNVVWIALLLCAGVMIVLAVRSQRHHVELTELGAVSEQWLADQRA